MAEARVNLGIAKFDEALSRGRAMSIEAALAFAIEPEPSLSVD